MAMQILSLHRPTFDRRILVAGAAALALLAYLPLSQVGAPNYADLAANRDVEMHTARIPVANINDLTKQSDAVVVGRVTASGAVHFIKPEGQTPLALQPDSRLGSISKSKDAPALSGAPARANDGILQPPTGIPVTDFSLQITQVLQGKVTTGSTITVTQPGGQITLPQPKGSQAPVLVRTLVAEHDPLMIVGQEQVLFLQQATDGTFHVTGGPDGRFSLDARRTLKPVDDAAPIGQAQKGQTLEQLAGKINVIKSGGVAN